MEKYDKENPAKKITPHYQFREHTKGTKLLKYKTLVITVPDEIVDNVKEWITRAKLSPQKLKKKIDGIRGKLLEEKNRRMSVSFNDPLNRSSLMRTQSLLSARNTSLKRPSKVHSTPQHSSAVKKSLFNVTKQNRTINDETLATPLDESMDVDIPFDLRFPAEKRKLHQLTIDKSMRIVKYPHREQEGKGIQRKWEKI